jgi:hypothetical protein
LAIVSLLYEHPLVHRRYQVLPLLLFCGTNGTKLLSPQVHNFGIAYFYQLFNWFSEIPAANTKSPSAAAAEKEAHGKPCIRFFLNRKHCGRR